MLALLFVLLLILYASRLFGLVALDDHLKPFLLGRAVQIANS